MGITVSILLLIVTAVWAASSTQPAIASLSDITIDPLSGDRIYNGQSFTGEARQYDESGTLMRAEQFVNGRRSGHFKMWFRSSLPAFESVYVNGRREGLAKSWWSNGKQRSETWFVNDMPHGVARSWYSSGEKYKRYQYDLGAPTGLQQAWRKNGKLFSNFEYRNGRSYGLRNSNLCVELEDEKIAQNYSL